jgi:hypothetical protein
MQRSHLLLHHALEVVLVEWNRQQSEAAARPAPLRLQWYGTVRLTPYVPESRGTAARAAPRGCEH